MAELAIEVADVAKSFRIPRPSGQVPLHQRFVHPLSRPGRDLQALRDVSFEVERGEFFGIIGRNGSGKSTLLKLLAGTYRADRGRIRVAGRLAPFLELGLGFNPELPAADNVVLNAVMMGLSPAEARRRSDEVIEFAGLDEFTDLSLKNYSSGMRVRLGFAVMTHVDADVLLVDEVLAVGDAEFAERCDQVFRRMHAAGRTIVLVSHSMPSITEYCDRALLIEDGVVDSIGPSAEVAERYMSINLSKFAEHGGNIGEQLASLGSVANPAAQIADAHLVDEAGERTATVGEGEPIRLRARLEIGRDIEDPGVYYSVTSEQGVAVLAAPHPDLGDAPGTAGSVIGLQLELQNPLAPGRYVLSLGVNDRSHAANPGAVANVEVVDFEVAGQPRPSLLKPYHEASFEPLGAAQEGR
jgi:ABC-2 type transport system ATP-binding protein